MLSASPVCSVGQLQLSKREKSPEKDDELSSGFSVLAASDCGPCWKYQTIDITDMDYPPVSHQPPGNATVQNTSSHSSTHRYCAALTQAAHLYFCSHF